jgi:hypothetical protein
MVNSRHLVIIKKSIRISESQNLFVVVVVVNILLPEKYFQERVYKLVMKCVLKPVRRVTEMKLVFTEVRAEARIADKFQLDQREARGQV